MAVGARLVLAAGSTTLLSQGKESEASLSWHFPSSGSIDPTQKTGSSHSLPLGVEWGRSHSQGGLLQLSPLPLIEGQRALLASLGEMRQRISLRLWESSVMSLPSVLGTNGRLKHIRSI